MILFVCKGLRRSSPAPYTMFFVSERLERRGGYTASFIELLTRLFSSLTNSLTSEWEIKSLDLSIDGHHLILDQRFGAP